MSVYTEIRNQEFMAQVCPTEGCMARRVVASGLIAGVSSAAFQILVGAFLTHNPFAFLQLAAGMLLGREALEYWFPISVSLPVGIAIHMILSVLFAAGYLLVLRSVPWPVDTLGKTIAAASAYALVLWLSNFYVIAPLFGWYWFLNMTDPLLQGLAAHGIFYGVVLGLCFGHSKEPTER